jgi:hypothetical protein
MKTQKDFIFLLYLVSFCLFFAFLEKQKLQKDFLSYLFFLFGSFLLPFAFFAFKSFVLF